MKSRETLIRLKKFQVDERRRKVAQIEAMIAEFERISGDLDRDIKTEQDRTGIHDPNHFAYPTYAKAAMHSTRRHTASKLRSCTRSRSGWPMRVALSARKRWSALARSRPTKSWSSTSAKEIFERFASG